MDGRDNPAGILISMINPLRVILLIKNLLEIGQSIVIMSYVE